MHIKELSVQNIKRIRHAVVTPAGRLVKVEGPNRNGKSSLLDAITYAIEGGRTMPEQPIHKGESKGEVSIKAGPYSIRRSVTQKGTYLTVENVLDGKKMDGQRFLDELLGKNATDVMTFFQKEPRDQRKLLAQLCRIDTAAFDADIAKARREAAELDTALTVLRGQLAEIPEAQVPEKPVDVAEVMAKLSKANERNEELRRDRERVEAQRRAVAAMAERIQSICDRIDALTTELRMAEKTRDEACDAMEAAEALIAGEEPVDTAELQKTIETAQTVNAAIEQQARRRKLMDNIEAKAATLMAVELRAKEFDQDKRDAIKHAPYPVPGLEITDDGILYNGIPLSQASGCERIFVGLAIVASLLPVDGLRVCRIKDGGDIDEESFKELAALAERLDVQVWVERATTVPSEDGSIFIIDGTVKGE